MPEVQISRIAIFEPGRIAMRERQKLPGLVNQHGRLVHPGGEKVGATTKRVVRVERKGDNVVVYFTPDGRVAYGRLDDFKGMQLRPALNPNSRILEFVDGPVLDRANRVLAATPELQERFFPVRMRGPKFDNLKFEFTPTDAMFYAQVRHGANGKMQKWPKVHLVPLQDILLSPAAVVLNYGQGLFEGMKALINVRGERVLFRPHENGKRAQKGAHRLCLQPVPLQYYHEAVVRTVLANLRWIPPMGKGALYIRPLLIGSGPKVGVAPSDEYTFIVFVTPVGPYFEGGVETIGLSVTEDFHRAVIGGTGNVKSIGNYALSMLPAKLAKKCGFREIVYLDAMNEHFEEVGAANVFIVIGNKIITPKLQSGTILPGITRDSVMQLAKKLGYEVVEADITKEMLAQATEVFCTGTAAVISPIGFIQWGDKVYIFENGKNNIIQFDASFNPKEVKPPVGQVTLRLYDNLTGIQEGRIEDPFGWVEEARLAA